MRWLVGVLLVDLASFPSGLLCVVVSRLRAWKCEGIVVSVHGDGVQVVSAVAEAWLSSCVAELVGPGFVFRIALLNLPKAAAFREIHHDKKRARESMTGSFKNTVREY